MPALTPRQDVGPGAFACRFCILDTPEAHTFLLAQLEGGLQLFYAQVAQPYHLNMLARVHPGYWRRFEQVCYGLRQPPIAISGPDRLIAPIDTTRVTRLTPRDLTPLVAGQRANLRLIEEILATVKPGEEIVQWVRVFVDRVVLATVPGVCCGGDLGIVYIPQQAQNRHRISQKLRKHHIAHQRTQLSPAYHACIGIINDHQEDPFALQIKHLAETAQRRAHQRRQYRRQEGQTDPRATHQGAPEHRAFAAS